MMKRKKSKLSMLLDRLREPSSLAAIAGLAVMAGRSTQEGQAIGDVAGVVLGTLAVLVPERGGPGA